MFRAPEGTTLERRLGVGSTFEVALVRLADGGGCIAKRPAPRLRGSETGARAVEREARAIRAVSSAALPGLIFDGRDEAGPYVCETIAPGAALRSLTDGRPIAADVWRTVAREASAALVTLHGRADGAGPLAFVHGDLSPDNVFFDGSRVTFVDLASSIWRAHPDPVFPDARGTAPYVAPEIARGETGASHRGDTYALAAVLAWLLVGPLTEASEAAAMLAEVGDRGLRVERLAARRDLPHAAIRPIVDALAFAPGDRLGSSRELAQRLAEAW